MFDRVLVGFDGSHHARRAFDMAMELAGRFGSHLTIAVVRAGDSGSDDPVLEGLVPFTEDGRSLTTLLDEAKETASRKGAASVRTVFLKGDVAPALLGLLEREPQDLVVVGSRGLTPGRRLLLGSVSTNLVQEAPCPVLVVRTHRGHRAARTAPPKSLPRAVR